MAVIDSTAFKDGNRFPFDPDNLSAEEGERLERYRKMWNFYRGKHWSYDRSKDEPVVTYNLCRPLVDLLATFLFGDGFQITIPDDPSTEENEQQERHFIKAALDTAWARRGLAPWCYGCGQMGSVSGDVFIRVSVDRDVDDGVEFPRADVIPSHYCFPVLDPDDNTRMTAIRVSWPVWEERDVTEGIIRRRTPRRRQIRVKSEVWTSKEVVTMIDKEIIEKKPNRLGELPFVHIANLPIAGDFYGMSDLAEVCELNREMNEKLTDISDVINYHGSPLTVVTGARLGQLERGPNRMWALPEGAAIQNLKLDGDLKATVDYIEALRKAMFEVCMVPNGALGREAAAGSTGAGQAMLYMPLLKRRDIKMGLYGQGIQRVNRLMLRYQELLDPAFSKKMEAIKNSRFRTKIVFPDPLPRDEGVQLQNAEKRMSLGLSSREDELKEMGHGEKSVGDKLDRADRDRARLFEQELEAELPKPKAPKTGKGRGSVRPSPDAAGEKISRKRGE